MILSWLGSNFFCSVFRHFCRLWKISKIRTIQTALYCLVPKKTNSKTDLTVWITSFFLFKVKNIAKKPHNNPLLKKLIYSRTLIYALKIHSRFFFTSLNNRQGNAAWQILKSSISTKFVDFWTMFCIRKICLDLFWTSMTCFLCHFNGTFEKTIILANKWRQIPPDGVPYDAGDLQRAYRISHGKSTKSEQKRNLESHGNL